MEAGRMKVPPTVSEHFNRELIRLVTWYRAMTLTFRDSVTVRLYLASAFAFGVLLFHCYRNRFFTF